MSKTPHTSHHEIYAIRRARNIFLGLLRDGRHKLPVKNRKCTPLRCTAVKKILLSGEQLQLARKCDWTSLRANIICFVRQPVFFKFRSRKLNAQTNVRAYNLQARKCNWISLRADIICFVSWTVFLMFCSRKIAYFEEQIIFMDKFSSLIQGYCVYHSSNIITWKHSIGSEFDPVQWRSLIRLPEQKVVLFFHK